MKFAYYLCLSGGLVAAIVGLMQGDKANQHRDALVHWYGPDRGKSVKFAEAFELCEYGRQPTPAELRKLFPFVN